MKKYRVNNYMVSANSVSDAVKIVKAVKDFVGSDLREYQKWVDYDMKKYGKISEETRSKIRKAGLEIIKSRYGDYEVIARDSVGDSIQIKAFYGDWKTVSKEQAKDFVKTMIKGMNTVPEAKKPAIIENKHLRGISVKELLKDATKDSVTVREVIESLVAEETSAIASYNAALETLKDHIPDEAYEAIKAIIDDEQSHVENLYAVLNGNVTPKNLEDSVKDDTVMFPGSKLYKVAIKYGFLDNEKLAKKIAADPEWQAIINKYRDPLYSAPSSIDRIVKKYMK